MRKVKMTEDCVRGAQKEIAETPNGLKLVLGEGKTTIRLEKFRTTAASVSFRLNIARLAGPLELCFEQRFRGGARNGIWLEIGPGGKAGLHAGSETHDHLDLAYAKWPKSRLTGKRVRNLYAGTEAIEMGIGRSVPCLFSVDFGSSTGSVHYLARIGRRIFEYYGRNTGSLPGDKFLSSSITLTQSSRRTAALSICDLKVADKPAQRSSLEKPPSAKRTKKARGKRQYCMMLSPDTDISSLDRDFAAMSGIGLTHACLVDTRYGAFTPDVFDVYDAAIQRAAGQGLKSYLCVYTCGRPYMLGQKGFTAEPMVNWKGQKHKTIENLWDVNWQRNGGLRKYLATLADHYAGNPNVAGYVIDEPLRDWVKASEQGYDLTCERQFRAFLRKKYRTLDRLNGRWKSSFKSWERVCPPTPPQARKFPARWSDWREARCSWSTGFFANVQKHLKAPDPTKRVVWSIVVPSTEDATVRQRELNCVDYDAVIPLLDSILFAVTIPGTATGMDPDIAGIVDREDLKGKPRFAAHCWFSIHHGGRRPTLAQARHRLNVTERLFGDCDWYGWAFKQCGPFDMGLQDDLSVWPEHRKLLSQFITNCEKRKA